MIRRQHSYTLFYIWALVLGSICILSCDDQRIYDAYEHVPTEGWERNRSFTFAVDKVQKGGEYQQWIGLRAHQAYPFRTVNLIVSQTIFPSKKVLQDTVTCDIINEQGRLDGKKGISSTEIMVPLRKVKLQQGDSLSISVRHDMRRDVLPGISDVGIKIELRF